MSSTSRTVLVVDDDADMREALRDTLEQEGHRVAEARDGSDALRWLAANPPPSIILLDWNMAPLNGAGFLQERALKPALTAIPVVLLTADARVAGERLDGVVARLKKPIDLEALLALLEQYAVGRQP